MSTKNMLLLNQTQSFHELDKKQQDSISNSIQSTILHAKREKWFIDIGELHISPEPFAHGGFAHIYNCTWRGIEIAVKKPKKKQLRSIVDILKEVQIWNTIRHPNIVQFLGLSISDTTIHIMLEKVNGYTLEKYIQNRKSYFPTRNIDKKLVHDLIKVFYFLHNAKPRIIYRDLKPDNILIEANGKLKLTDLGLSRFILNSDTNVMTGDVGSYRWMCPDVYQGKSYNLSADIYSLGLLIHYIFSKKKPFSQQGEEDIIKFLNSPDDSLICFVEKKQKWYTPCIRKCININPSERCSIEEVYNTIVKKVPPRGMDDSHPSLYSNKRYDNLYAYTNIQDIGLEWEVSSEDSFSELDLKIS